MAEARGMMLQWTLRRPDGNDDDDVLVGMTDSRACERTDGMQGRLFHKCDCEVGRVTTDTQFWL